MLCTGLARAVEINQRAPEFTLRDGKTEVSQTSLASFKGQWVYLDFWASWCVPCKLSFPWMNDLQTRFAAQGLRVVAVNVDARGADAERFLATVPAKFTVLFDPAGDSPKRYALKAMPSSVLIDPSGTIKLVHAGFRDADRATLEAAIAKFIAQGNRPQ